MRKFLYFPGLVILCLMMSVLIQQPVRADSSKTLDNFDKIDTYINNKLQSLNLPGLALGIIKGDKIAYLQGYGQADPQGKLVTPQTPFILGSTSKSFTAMAIMQLVEAKKIELDTPVKHYLPQFEVGTATQTAAITVRHLLNQVSGIPTNAGAHLLADNGNTTIEQAIQTLKNLPLTRPVGSSFQYSNLNYVILGLIIQTVSGQSYANYIHDHIFRPLEMEQSFTSQTDAQQHGMATGYRWWFGKPIPTNLPYISAEISAGYIISSAADMAQYLIPQLNNGQYNEKTILSQNSNTLLHHGTADMGNGEQYAMGWMNSSVNGEAIIHHGGDVANFHSDILIAPKSQWGIVLLMNCNGTLASMTGSLERLPVDILNLLTNNQPATGTDFWQIYLLVDIIVLFCSILLFWRFMRLLLRRKQPFRRGFWNILGLVFCLCGELIIPGILIIMMPQIFPVPWPVIVLFMPDIGYWLLAFCCSLLIMGIIRSVFTIAQWRDRKAITRI